MTALATTPPVPTRWVNCPNCKSACEYSGRNPYRPFCSGRCKGLDFGAWASEDFRVQAQPDLADERE